MVMLITYSILFQSSCAEHFCEIKFQQIRESQSLCQQIRRHRFHDNKLLFADDSACVVKSFACRQQCDAKICGKTCSVSSILGAYGTVHG